MSYTTLYYVTPTGRLVVHSEYRNAFRSAFMVWDNLFNKYCEERVKELKQYLRTDKVSPMQEADSKLVWALASDPNVPKTYRAVLASTFDNVVLYKKDFDRFYNDVLEYAEEFPCGNLIKQIQSISSLKKKNIIGVCWNQTSVCSAWEKYNIKHYAHWDLYKEIDGVG